MRIRGRKEIFPYALFEALKVRDHRLEPVPSNIIYCFSISLTLVVIVGLQRQGLLSLSFAS